jgi:hypothetical protein
VLVSHDSVVPYLGASGAISGVMGAYFFIFPLNKVKCWFGWFVGVIELPSVFVVGGWFLIQYFSTVMAVTTGQVHTGIAYWSHLGGFVCGIAFILVTLAILKHQQRQQQEAEALAEVRAEAAVLQTESSGVPEADELFARAAEARGSKPGFDPFQNFLPEKPQKDERVSAAR